MPVFCGKFKGSGPSKFFLPEFILNVVEKSANSVPVGILTAYPQGVDI